MQISGKFNVFNLDLTGARPSGRPHSRKLPWPARGPQGSRPRDPEAEPALGIAPSQAGFLSTINGCSRNCASMAPAKPVWPSLCPPSFFLAHDAGLQRGPFRPLVVPSLLGTWGEAVRGETEHREEAAALPQAHPPPPPEVGAVTSAIRADGPENPGASRSPPAFSQPQTTPLRPSPSPEPPAGRGCLPGGWIHTIHMDGVLVSVSWARHPRPSPVPAPTPPIT